MTLAQEAVPVAQESCPFDTGLPHGTGGLSVETGHPYGTGGLSL
jgi:hypothetical protein